MKYVGKDGLKVNGKEVWHEGNFDPDGKQDAIGYTPVNKAGDTVNGDLKVNGNIIAGTELIVGYNGTTESLQRHKWKYNGSTGYLELWRYSNQNKWELSATFPNRNTGLGGITVEGKQVATEDYVNGKVKTDVPVGAKFTDTTYTEISESEINTGTASTLRTITARRIKFILDKVQGWINNLTKVDVGLGDVDNVQQATKTEFNAHNNDNTRHITTNERTAWNNKWDYNETTIENVKVNNAVNADTVNGKTVAVSVPAGAKFTDTITTINGKTGAIAKADITALGIPAQDTVYTHPSTHPASMITESASRQFVSDTEKAAWNNKQNALGYTPVNKTGDSMTGNLSVEATTFPVVDITCNTSSTGGNVYGGARMVRKTTNPANGVGIGFYFQAPNSNKTIIHAGMFGGALGTIAAGSEKGEIVFGPSYAGQDPYTRRDLVIRAISASKAEAELNGKLRTDQTLSSDSADTVATKKYVDDKVASGGIQIAVGTSEPSGLQIGDWWYKEV